MGLFRRGTKLLKLGSGLRDCCCRPENPEECWCPDWCRYYWDWEGNGSFPADTFLENQCTAGRTYSAFSAAFKQGFGIVVADQYSSESAEIVATSESGNLDFPFLAQLIGNDLALVDAIDITFDIGANGPVSQATHDAVFDSVSGTANADIYFHKVIFGLGCYSDADGKTSLRLQGFSGCQILIRQQNQIGTSPTNPIVNFWATVDIPIQSTCVPDENLACFPNDILARHAENQIEIVFDEDNVTVGGTAYPWNILDIDVLSFPRRTFAEGDAITTDYRVENKFPIEGTLTLKKKSFCIAGDCDCTESLTGMTVTFEGKTFTYGSLEQFVDGVDTWEETLPGLFRRTTRETCDGTYVAAVKIAEVFCETVDGTDYWTVYLDSECYERDEATCPASADARRIMQWTGVFTCGEDGKPGGTPHSATDAAEPPDLDSNTTLGTPAAECAGDLDLPAISFG